ncbi:hypothetical protein [Mycobacteroides abscessus]|uniref:hypothetical protein n=1 Tax=Mycobacteroides abscessus TaxID=36809 RepID=UPI0005E0396C|nr:hypothetical protein [Mycobacteroides abscessus]CPR90877.1 Uncharacterised protein [Mycobacteroides abscessus]CPR95946.1 Uncharacterised protein [Mycobacteroides abscessus]CPS40274.1 Uncharacterised protein [Mycobacteroides abscessus]CPV10246.1 Uncharacterised protein [Mycobacteroides abscessus]
MPKYRVNVGGDGPEGWTPIPPDAASDPHALVVYVREPAAPSGRIVVRERFINWPTVDVQKYAQEDAERLNAKITRGGYISYQPVRQYGLELEFTEGDTHVKGYRLYSTTGTADGQSFMLELLFSAPSAQYDQVKPEFVSFLQNLKVVEDEG